MGEIIARTVSQFSLVKIIDLKAENGILQFKKGVGYLQHENVRVVVFMADQYTLARPAHAMFLIVFFQPFQSCKH